MDRGSGGDWMGDGDVDRQGGLSRIACRGVYPVSDAPKADVARGGGSP